MLVEKTCGVLDTIIGGGGGNIAKGVDNGVVDKGFTIVGGGDDLAKTCSKDDASFLGGAAGMEVDDVDGIKSRTLPS